MGNDPGGFSMVRIFPRPVMIALLKKESQKTNAVSRTSEMARMMEPFRNLLTTDGTEITENRDFARPNCRVASKSRMLVLHNIADC